MAKHQRPDPRRPQPQRPLPKPQVQKKTEPGTGILATSFSKWEPAGWLTPALIVLAITAVLYLPIWFFQYLNWDDAQNIYENPNLANINATTLRDMFTLEKGNVIGGWNPLSIFTFALEKMILGKQSPEFSHFINWLLHLGTVFFVIRCLLHLGISKWGAFVGGLLFGIHPMRVESVAWATERKDVLFAIFFFAALMYYIRWVKTEPEKRNWLTYFWIVILAALSHLSKIQAVAFVLSLYLVDWWLARKWTFQNFFLEKLPFGLMALATGLANIYTLKLVGTIDESMEVATYTPLDRFFIGTYSYSVYLYKLLIPFPLSPLYPYEPTLPPLAKFTPIVFFGTLAVGLWMFFKGKARAWVFGLFFFFFNVVALLQWKPAGQGFLADRFTYVPYFGFFFLAAWLWDKYAQKEESAGLVKAVAGVFFVMCAVLSFRHIKIWENGYTLWSHVIQFKGTSIAMGWGNRAQYLRNNGDFERALQDYDQAIAIAPSQGGQYNSRGKAYFDMATSGKYNNRQKELAEKAIADYNKGLDLQKNIKPKAKSELLANRGAANAMIGNFEQAEKDLTAAIEADPTHKNSYSNRSLMYLQLKQWAKAIPDQNKLLELDPYDAKIWLERGIAKNNTADYAGAIPDLQRAAQLKPDLKFAYYHLAVAYSKTGDKARAQQEVQNCAKHGLKLTEEDLKFIGL